MHGTIDAGSVAYFGLLGRVTVTRDNWLHVTASPDELAAWWSGAHSGLRWVCASLRGCTEGVAASFDASGNLLDLTDAGGGEVGTDDLDGHEVSAWVADVLASVGVVHPAGDRI